MQISRLFTRRFGQIKYLVLESPAIFTAILSGLLSNPRQNSKRIFTQTEFFLTEAFKFDAPAAELLQVTTQFLKQHEIIPFAIWRTLLDISQNVSLPLNERFLDLAILETDEAVLPALIEELTSSGFEVTPRKEQGILVAHPLNNNVSLRIEILKENGSTLEIVNIDKSRGIQRVFSFPEEQYGSNKTTTYLGCSLRLPKDSKTALKQSYGFPLKRKCFFDPRYDAVNVRNHPLALNEESPLLSCIVPVHNTGKRLWSMMDSVLSQSLENLELLVVDDNSNQDTVLELEKLKSKDSRVTIIRHKEQQGPGTARNTGLKAARGEYVTFLDDDDFIFPGFLTHLYELLVEFKVNTAESGVRYEVSDGSLATDRQTVTQINKVAGNDVSLHSLLRLTPHAKMFRTSFLHEKQLYFDEGERSAHGEDTLFVQKLIAQQKDVVRSNRCDYIYKWNSSGQTNNEELRLHRVLGYLGSTFLLCKRHIEYGFPLSEEAIAIPKSHFLSVLHHWAIRGLNIKSTGNKKELTDLFSTIENSCLEEETYLTQVLPNWREEIEKARKQYTAS